MGLEREEKEPKITGLVGAAEPDVVHGRPGELELHRDSALPGSREDRRDAGSVAVEG